MEVGKGTMAFDPARVAVATVLENREPFWLDVLTLFRSLERFGGTMAKARRLAYFVDSVHPAIASNLEQLDVEVEVVSRVHGRVRNANKLAMLREHDGVDLLVALDNDLVVTRDFSAEVEGSSIAARAVFVERLTLDEWSRLFSFFSLELPAARYRMISTLRETVSLNSGVLLVPGPLIEPLRNAWAEWIDHALSARDVIPKLQRYPDSDQFGFCLALAASRLPTRELPVNMNYPASGHVHPLLRSSRAPYLLHHHHKLTSDSGLPLSRFPALNRTIRRLNRALFRANS